MTTKWCIYCAKYDLRDIHSRGYRCTKHHRPMAIDEHCSSWSDGLRSDKTVEDAIKTIKKYGYNGKADSSYWYVTSTVCKLAGLTHNNRLLEAFAKLREYLLSFDEGIRFYVNYNFNGPFIKELLLEGNEDTYIQDELLPTLEIFADQTEMDNMDAALFCYQSIMDGISDHYDRHPYVNVEGYIDENDTVIIEDNSDVYCKK